MSQARRIAMLAVPMAGAFLFLMQGPVVGAADRAAEASLSGLAEALLLYEGSSRCEALRVAAEGSVDPMSADFLVEEVVRRSHERGFTDEELLALLHRTERLLSADLPVTPVLDRYLEGMAKGVPFPLLDRVSQNLESLLQDSARQVDREYPVPQDESARRARLLVIDHGAYALDMGIRPELLDESISIARSEMRPYEEGVAPVLTLGILVGSGVNPDKSMDVVNLAWNRGYRGEALERLGEGLGRVAGDPGAVDQVLRMIDEGASQDRVFEGLDEMVGRGGTLLRLPGMSPADDPGTRRGGDRRDDPQDQPRQRQEQPGVRGE